MEHATAILYIDQPHHEKLIEEFQANVRQGDSGPVPLCDGAGVHSDIVRLRVSRRLPGNVTHTKC